MKGVKSIKVANVIISESNFIIFDEIYPSEIIH